MEGQQHGEQLKRGLKNRHIQLIALGGAIGTGLFLGSASVIQSAGPGIILGYAIAGFIAFLINGAEAPFCHLSESARSTTGGRIRSITRYPASVGCTPS